MLESYKQLVEFLGLMLGPQYKIVLYDLTARPPCVAAIAGGTLEGEGIGAPLTDLARHVLEEYGSTSTYKVGFSGRTRSGTQLSCSDFFIKDHGRVVGMLCVNMDVTAHLQLCSQVLQMGALDGLFAVKPAGKPAKPAALSESFSNVRASVAQAVRESCGGVAPERLTQKEKMAVVRTLQARGMFAVKGAVGEVAQALSCSNASIYRYLSKLTE